MKTVRDLAFDLVCKCKKAWILEWCQHQVTFEQFLEKVIADARKEEREACARAIEHLSEIKGSLLAGAGGATIDEVYAAAVRSRKD